MEVHLPDNVNLRWSSSPFLIPTTCSIKFPTEATHSNPNSLSSFLTVKAKNNSQKSNQQDIQKLTKKHLSHILRTEAAILAIERKANSKKYNRLWPKAVLEALDDAIRQLRWESALKIFGLLRQQHWYEARCQTYTKLLVMLGKCRQPKQAGLLYEVMLTDGLKPTIDCYTALVSAYGLSGFIEKALEIIDHMKSIDECKPDVHTYSVLINCCTKFRRFNMIEHILAEMSYLGIECSVVTYNTIIDGYGKAQMFGLMESTLNDMLESGNCHPDVFTFNSVIGAYGQCGMSEEMEKWFDEFQIMGIRPDVMTFNILIQSYGKVGMYDKMESVLDFMRKRFISPTIVTFNIVIETFGKAGLIKRMEEFFLNMKHQGMKPNAITYCSLVSAYSKAGLMNKVDSVMRQVDNCDVILDTPFFNCAISAYGLAGNVERMSELFLDMEDRRCKPDFNIDGHYPVRELWARARNCWDKILAHESRSVLVVAHNAVNQALVGTAIGLGTEYFRILLQSNCGVSVLDFVPRPDGGSPSICLNRLNQTPSSPIAKGSSGGRKASKRIVLVCHGSPLADSEVARGMSMNMLGIIQSQKTAELLLDLRVKTIFSSTSPSSSETANAIARVQEAADCLGADCVPRYVETKQIKDLDVQTILQQSNKGSIELPVNQLEEELLTELWDQSGKAWKTLLDELSSESEPESVVIAVTHPTINIALLSHCLSLTKEWISSFHLDAGSISVIDFPDGPAGRGVVRCINYTAHLGRWSIPITRATSNDEEF